MTTHKDKIVARLRRKAKTASDVQRSMAQAKSLRQEGHDPPRDDLYMWPTPEQTTEWQAADLIEQQASTIEKMEGALAAIIDRAPERDVKWAGMTPRDIALAALRATEARTNEGDKP